MPNRTKPPWAQPIRTLARAAICKTRRAPNAPVQRSALAQLIAAALTAVVVAAVVRHAWKEAVAWKSNWQRPHWKRPRWTSRLTLPGASVAMSLAVACIVVAGGFTWAHYSPDPPNSAESATQPVTTPEIRQTPRDVVTPTTERAAQPPVTSQPDGDPINGSVDELTMPGRSQPPYDPPDSAELDIAVLEPTTTEAAPPASVSLLEFAPAQTPLLGDAPAAARSWYVSWLTGDTEVDTYNAYLRACAQAMTTPPGLVVVSFGRQVGGGATGFNPANPIPYDNLAATASAFARGLHECSDGNWMLSLGTSNNGGVTDHNGFEGGRLWAGLVNDAAERSSGLRVEVIGGIDMEPAWGPVAQGRAWLDGYLNATGRAMVNFGSADGCPRTYDPAVGCANGWTLDDMVHVATGAGQTLWMAPEIYDNNGALAAQWATIAAHGSARGIPVRFIAVVTQQGACITVDDPACPRLDNSPAEAWNQFRDVLAAYGNITFQPPWYATDIDW
jgi:hypothetical protein